MGAKGIARQIDGLGRVVIPSEMRRSLGIIEGDELEFVLVTGGIYIRSVKGCCSICGSMKNLIAADGNSLCRDCYDKFAQAVRNGG